jgi:hemerythrin-like domain-containing protein
MATRLNDELLSLLRRHPRDTWREHPRLGDLSRFWLARHAWFRRADAEIARKTSEAIERRIDPDEFAQWLVASMNRFLGELEGHHSIEDHHYFPVFRAMEPNLAEGFDLLDGDHDNLHAAIDEIAASANTYLRADRADPAAVADALARFGDVRERLGAGLLRHLDDEEDLIIPLILDRGEEAIGG